MLAEQNGMSRNDFVLMALSNYVLQLCEQEQVQMNAPDDPAEPFMLYV